jgi:hypothetical protein
MINPPQVLPEEPTAVTPHGGFCGGKSQQWLRYPTMPHIRFCAGVSVMGIPTAINQTSCGFSSNFFSGTACHQFCHVRDRAS